MEVDLACLLLKTDNSQESRDARASIILRSVSKLFGEKLYRFDQGFLRETKKLGAEMEEVMEQKSQSLRILAISNYSQQVEFADSPGPVREYINRLIADSTDGEIKEFFSADDINSQTKLAIVSALYFKVDLLYNR